MKKLVAIESLRGWLAWWVVLGHAADACSVRPHLPRSISWLLKHVDIPVDLFMMVSGFVIAGLISRKRESYPAYITRRWFRLMPLMTILFLIALATQPLYRIAYIDNPWTVHPLPRLVRMASQHDWWPEHVGLHALLLHGLVPDSLLPYASSSFLPPAWSVSLEWQFYLVAPLLVFALKDRRGLWIACGAVVVSAIVLSGAIGAWRFPAFLPLTLPFFLAGIASWLLFEDRQRGAVGLAAMSFIPWLALTRVGGLQTLAIAMPVWAITMLGVASEAGHLSYRSKLLDRVLKILLLNRAIRSIGQVSFSTYLVHMPLIWILVGSALIFLPVTESVVYAATAVALALTALASWMLFRWVEQPGNAAGRQAARWIENGRVAA